MSAKKPAPAPTAAELRAARLAATEARLRGDPPPPSPASGYPAQPPPPPWKPTEQGDKETRREFNRLLYRGIVRDNGYKQASDCLETLSKITSNVLAHPDEAKYREFRAENAGIKAKVLLAQGGHEYLIALGFRTRTLRFEKQYVLEPTLRRMHELKIGHDVLIEALPEVQARVHGLSTSTSSHASDEAARRARALAEYEADRDLVKERVKREKLGREAAAAAAAEAALAAEQAAQEVEKNGQLNPDPQQEQEQKEQEEEEEEEITYGKYRGARAMRRWGQGQALGVPNGDAHAPTPSEIKHEQKQDGQQEQDGQQKEPEEEGQKEQNHLLEQEKKQQQQQQQQQE